MESRTSQGFDLGLPVLGARYPADLHLHAGVQLVYLTGPLAIHRLYVSE